MDNKIPSFTKMDDDVLAAAFNRGDHRPGQLGSIQVKAIIEYFSADNRRSLYGVQSANEDLYFRKFRND